MIFTSFEFILFFVAVFLIRNSIRNFNAERWFLLLASYAFYASWSVYYLGLILFTSTVDWFVGRKLGLVQAPHQRKILLTISMVLNLGLLGYFKYTNFLLTNISFGLNALGLPYHPDLYKILLPVGISFFTFQSMSYTIDVYRKQIEPCQNLKDFLLYVAFFPQLVAGPIVRAADLLPQLLKRVRASATDIETGLVLFAVGAIKKAVLSDQIAPHVDTIFADPSRFDGPTLLLGVIGYAVQIYCDFSGYTDMAIGCARMLGYRFPENFQMPYSSVNITEFWRRWHISLSTWLRDYLYIPLGGNRLGTGRTYANLMITMLIGGLWHGASWNFIIWGGLHGAALAVHKAWRQWIGKPSQQPFWLHWPTLLGSRFLTLAIVLIGWVFFRAQTYQDATHFLSRMLSLETGGTRLLSPQILGATLVVFFIHLFISKDRNWAEEIPTRSAPERVLAYASLIFTIACFGATDAAPFIYFQF
jgi:alginate O-acetyltransferase complex protein AlgI